MCFVCPGHSTRVVCNETTCTVRCMPCRALRDRLFPSVDNGIWKQEVATRREALQCQNGRPAVLDSIGRMNALIDLCPVTWVRDLARIATCKRRRHLSRPRCCFCCAYHPMYELRYGGQTGAQESFRVAERFYDEIEDAQRWQQTYGKKRTLGDPIHTYTVSYRCRIVARYTNLPSATINGR